MKYAHDNFPEHKLTYLNCLFCLTNSSKPQNIPFTIMENKANQQIFTLNKIESVNLFCLKNNLKP